MQFFTDNILLIFLLPLLTAIIAFTAHFFKFAISQKTVSVISTVTSIIGAIYAAALYYTYNNCNEITEFSVGWLSIGDLTISAGLLLDNISATFLLILMIVNIIIQIYSSQYFNNQKNYNLYFGYLNLLITSITALSLSSNLPQSYVFLELTGVLCYILTNFNYEKSQISESAKKSFIINRIGDMLLLSGIIVFIYFVLTYPISNNSELLSYKELAETAADFYVYLSDINFYIACILLFSGAIVKSAQFPFHIWLTDSINGPIPVSALIQSVATVSAGIILTIRLLPLFELSEPVLKTIIYIGLFTSVICAFFASGQYDIKKMLAYSTSSQLGIVFPAIALLNIKNTLFYMSVNSFAKVSLFLIAGILISFIPKSSSNMLDMPVSKHQYPFLGFCYLLTVFSLSGLFFNGFFIGEAILGQLLSQNKKIAASFYFLYLLLTSFYLFKSYFIIFKKNKKHFAEKNKISSCLIIPIILSIVFIFYPVFDYKTIILDFSKNYEIFKLFDIIPVSVPISVIAVILAYFAASNKISAPLWFKKLSLNGGYISNLYDIFIDYIVEFFRNFTNIIDYFFNFTAYIVKFFSWCVSVSQNGNIQTYISYAIFSSAVLLVLYLLLIAGIGGI